MRSLCAIFGLTATAVSTVSGQTVLASEAIQQQRAKAVQEAFSFAWDGYTKYAFGNDELHPVSNSFGNTRNGWGASAVDALSTAIVMKNATIVNQILKYIPTINFDKSYQNEVVSLFETTIRYMGGMISAYDFLTGPLSGLASNKKNVNALLTQSEKLAGLLSFAFDTPSGVPSNNLYFNNRSTDGATTNGLAQVGTLVLEWTHLSDLTGNKTYAKLSQKGQSYLLSPKPTKDEPYPGLVGTGVYLKDGTFTDATGGWVGGDDSFYEYLIKMYIYDPTRFSTYKDRWIAAADSSMAHLASQPSSRPDLTYLAEFSGKRNINESQHLACFDGGNFILGGNVLGRKDLVNFGLKLTEACHNTYISTATGIGPEVFSWNTTSLPKRQEAFYKQHGFWIEDGFYDLRPEVVESYYYAYQVTKDSKYQDWAWEAFNAINMACRANSGFSSILHVNHKGGGGKNDNQESFFYAEVMKYLYLIFSPEQEWDVASNGKNKWVYNTEAHPFPVASAS